MIPRLMEQSFPEMKDVSMLGSSEDDTRLEISLDTSGYKPEELKVQVKEDELWVEGKHEEKTESGDVMVSRKFCRRFGLPQGARKMAVESNLSQDGVMVITVPKEKKIEEVKAGENIKVEHVKDKEEMKKNVEKRDEQRRRSRGEFADSTTMESQRKNVSRMETSRDSSEGKDVTGWREEMMVPMTLRDPFFKDPFFKNSLANIESSREDFFKQARESFEASMKEMESMMSKTSCDSEWMKPDFWDKDFTPSMGMKDSCVIKQEEDDSKLEVHLDTVGYKPSELKVEVAQGVVRIEGKHEERSQAGQVMVSKQFSRQYSLPHTARPEDVVSSLSKDGVLVVTMHKQKLKEVQGKREVPIAVK